MSDSKTDDRPEQRLIAEYLSSKAWNERLADARRRRELVLGERQARAADEAQVETVGAAARPGSLGPQQVGAVVLLAGIGLSLAVPFLPEPHRGGPPAIPTTDVSTLGPVPGADQPILSDAVAPAPPIGRSLPARLIVPGAERLASGPNVPHAPVPPGPAPGDLAATLAEAAPAGPAATEPPAVRTWPRTLTAADTDPGPAAPDLPLMPAEPETPSRDPVEAVYAGASDPRIDPAPQPPRGTRRLGTASVDGLLAPTAPPAVALAAVLGMPPPPPAIVPAREPTEITPVSGLLSQPRSLVAPLPDGAPTRFESMPDLGRFALTLHAATPTGAAIDSIVSLGFQKPSLTSSPFAPSETLVVYFDAGSSQAAELLAGALGGSTEDLTGMSPGPPAGTIEVYLAR